MMLDWDFKKPKNVVPRLVFKVLQNHCWWCFAWVPAPPPTEGTCDALKTT